MKKLILITSILALSISANAQKSNQGTRMLTSPQSFSMPGDSSLTISFKSGDSMFLCVSTRDNNISYAMFNYSIINKKGNQIGVQGSFKCKNSCYDYYQNHLSKNIPFQIVADSALDIDIINH